MYNKDFIYAILYSIAFVGLFWTFTVVWWQGTHKGKNINDYILKATAPLSIVLILVAIIGLYVLEDFEEDKRDTMYESQEILNKEYEEKGNKYYIEGLEIRIDENGAELEEGVGYKKGKYMEVEYELKEGYSTLLYENRYKTKIIYK